MTLQVFEERQVYKQDCDEGFQPKVLKTLLGHTYPQVLVGALLGVILGIIFFA